MGTLLQRYRAHTKRLRRTGAELTEYECPSCGESIEAFVPGPGRVFDSLVICPHCEEQHIKVVHSDGRVTAEEF